MTRKPRRTFKSGSRMFPKVKGARFIGGRWRSMAWLAARAAATRKPADEAVAMGHSESTTACVPVGECVP